MMFFFNLSLSESSTSSPPSFSTTTVPFVDPAGRTSSVGTLTGAGRTNDILAGADARWARGREEVGVGEREGGGGIEVNSKEVARRLHPHPRP